MLTLATSSPGAFAAAVVVALLGGGVLTAGASVWLDKRRADREGEARKAADKSELRLATRLIIEELADSMTLVEEAVRVRTYWAAPRQLSTAVWTEYRIALAKQVESPLTWRIITTAFDQVNRLNWLVGYRAQQTRVRAERRARLRIIPLFLGAIPVTDGDETRQAWRAMRAGIRELEQLTAVMGPASRMLGEEGDFEAKLWPGRPGLSD